MNPDQSLLRRWTEAERGPKLARFTLFELMHAVWWELYGMDTEDWPPRSATMDFDDVASHFGHEWMKAMKRGDGNFFRTVADALDLIKDNGIELRPQYRLDAELISYFLEHETAPTIGELLDHCAKVSNLDWKLDNRAAHARQINRRCDALGLRIAGPRGRGRPRARKATK